MRVIFNKAITTCTAGRRGWRLGLADPNRTTANMRIRMWISVGFDALFLLVVVDGVVVVAGRRHGAVFTALPSVR